MRDFDIVIKNGTVLTMDAENTSIIDACDGENELQWIGRILTRIREMNEEPANGVDGPSAPSQSGG